MSAGEGSEKRGIDRKKYLDLNVDSRAGYFNHSDDTASAICEPVYKVVAIFKRLGRDNFLFSSRYIFLVEVCLVAHFLSWIMI